MKKIKTGDYIMTNRGYFGKFYEYGITNICFVGLFGCTYSDEYWYDMVPLKDIRLATKKEIKTWIK